MSINQYPEWIKCNELNAIQSQEIIALKERIKRLEEASQQLKSLNNKICEINLKVSQERDDLNVRIKRLEDWKQSALEVEREWDANAVATMLGAKLGESQRKVIQREVPLLLERIKRLEEAGDVIKASLQRSLNSNEQGECKWLAELPMTDAEFAVFTTAFKSKEAKP